MAARLGVSGAAGGREGRYWVKRGGARLRIQAAKQSGFVPVGCVAAPVVRSVSCGDDGAVAVCMDYVAGCSPLCGADADALWCAGVLAQFVLSNVSGQVRVEGAVVRDKLAGVAVAAPIARDECLALARLCPDELCLPAGWCHGDLTFCNVLYDGRTVWLLDFLDGYIESPLMDALKLRQDTAHHWIRVLGGAVDPVVLARADACLAAAFAGMAGWEYRWLLQGVNLARAMPYCAGPAREHLLAEVRRCIRCC